MLNALFFLGFAAVGVAFSKRSPDRSARVLLYALVILLPFGMNIAGFISGDMHLLMSFSVWLIYLLSLLLADRFHEGCAKKYAAV